ncbi:hypothetical protein PAXRUDRAFT_36788 [Paxillus rubicundulus Ve08.2h10]|uniref:Uncharacterized protein n=1 Tax=Paxillus rubicundulus Ve08.2h10 TaxID=930991 RepID=A0A0D0DAF5_9AGAM|nr:hypothetical protein PAXRUDRAFT_36788 [Paxillus rubicundulus Ve08.2h10]
MDMLNKTPTGALEYLKESCTVSLDATVEDQAEEIESLVNGLEVEDQLAEGTLQQGLNSEQPDDGALPKHQQITAAACGNDNLEKVVSEQLSTNPKLVSSCVVVDTIYWNQFKQFAATIKKVNCPDDINKLFPNIPMDFLTWIALWIMEKCDENDIWTGKPKPPTIPHATYGTAQKVHAAISHKFGCDYGLGTQAWMEHPMLPGKYVGNPSLSVAVSQYMVSLHRYKVWSGEAVTSAQAMDEVTMKQLFDFASMTKSKEYGPTLQKCKAENPAEWAGLQVQMMLYLLYLVLMLCLLHFDEALQITWADVVFQVKELAIDGHWYNATPELLMGATMLKAEDFFIHIGSDGISINATEGMSSSAFLECFHNNLLDIGVDP